jgi:hypothetical protein
MTTALDVLAGELRLTQLEHRMAKAILGGSPVSRAGAPALIPMDDLCAVIEAESGSESGGGDPEWHEDDPDVHLRDRVADCLANLLRSPRSLVPANGRANLTLFVLARVELGTTTFFAQCQFDSRFLALLRSVAAEQHLDPY